MAWVRVTVRDLETGEEDSIDVEDNYVLVAVGKQGENAVTLLESIRRNLQEMRTLSRVLVESNYALHDQLTAKDTEIARLRELAEKADDALRLAATRLEICHDRMMGCNTQDVELGNEPVHELIGDVVEWVNDAKAARAALHPRKGEEG